MWVQDSSTLSFLEVNEAFIKVIGYSKSELLALTAWDLEVTDSKNSNEVQQIQSMVLMK